MAIFLRGERVQKEVDAMLQHCKWGGTAKKKGGGGGSCSLAAGVDYDKEAVTITCQGDRSKLCVACHSTCSCSKQQQQQIIIFRKIV